MANAVERRGRLSRTEKVGLLVERSLDKWLSPLGVWVFRRTKGAIAGPWKVDALVLTTRGRRSGRERTVVLRYFPDGEAMILVAANDGGDAHPGWYYNLTAEPTARVEIEGRTVHVRAEELPPEEGADWWRTEPGGDRIPQAGLTIAESRRCNRTLGQGGRGLARSAKGAPQTRRDISERPARECRTRKLTTVAARDGEAAARG
jgi:deazaflavin-dependent oxidoreductase (nitroreductase family)